MAEIIILGAGMVGIGAALALQDADHQVVLVDRGPPGQETSHGNAGIIQVEAAEPYALPRYPGTLLRYAFGLSNDVAYDWRGLAAATPALFAYFRASAPRRLAATASVYALLTARAVADHEPLIAAAGAEALVRRGGYYAIYRSDAALARELREAERLHRDYGVAFRALDAAALAKEEPALKGGLPGALHWLDPWSIRDPRALVQAYVRLFAERGGRLVTGDALSLAQTGAGWQVTTAAGRVTAERAVVALGPWSPDLLKGFGYRIPMIWKRGYHGHFTMQRPPNLPLLDAANGVVASSMAQGLRITTGAEITDRAAPAHFGQLERGLAGLREILDIGDSVPQSRWFGHRPCLPRMLPLVGEAPRHKGLWFDFGHGHQGFTLGPTTGLILAELMTNRNDTIARALSPRAGV